MFVTVVVRYTSTYRGLTDGLCCWEVKDPREQPVQGHTRGGLPRCILTLGTQSQAGALESSEIYVMFSGAS